MKPVICLFLLSIATSGYAAPSNRPLPPGAVDQTHDHLLLRDHEVVDKFYLVPNALRVVEQEVSPYGDQTEGCEAVSNFLSAEKVLIKSKQELASLTLERTQLLRQLLNRMLTLEETQTKLLVEKQKIEAQIKEAEESGSLSAEEIEELRERLTTIEESTTRIDQTIANIEKAQTLVEGEQTKILIQVEKLEESVKTFQEKVKRPAAKIHVKLALFNTDFESANSKKALGLNEKASVHLPKVISVHLFPEQEDGFAISLGSTGESTIGVFEPEWSIEPLDFPEGYLGQSELSPAVEQKEFPSEVFFDQMISLYTYCSIKGHNGNKDELRYPLRVSYSIAQWRDKVAQNTSGIPLITFSKKLETPIWQHIAAIAAMETELPGGRDIGAPSYFKGEGTYEPYSINLRLLVKQTQ